MLGPPVEAAQTVHVQMHERRTQRTERLTQRPLLHEGSQIADRGRQGGSALGERGGDLRSAYLGLEVRVRMSQQRSQHILPLPILSADIRVLRAGFLLVSLNPVSSLFPRIPSLEPRIPRTNGSLPSIPSQPLGLVEADAGDEIVDAQGEQRCPVVRPGGVARRA